MRLNKKKIHEATVRVSKTQQDFIDAQEALADGTRLLHEAVADAARARQDAIRLLQEEHRKGTLLGAIEAWWNSLQPQPKYKD